MDNPETKKDRPCLSTEGEMDTNAVIIDDRTYIPLRFAGEALGFTVNWK